MADHNPSHASYDGDEGVTLELFIFAYIILIFIFWIRFVVAIRVHEYLTDGLLTLLVGLIGAIYWPVVLLGLIVWSASNKIISYIGDD